MLHDIVELEEQLAPLLRCHGEAPPDKRWLDVATEWSAAVWAAAEALGPAELDSAAVARGLALAEHPVFICGAHRSGTSLVRNLLDGHPALAVLPSEGSYYTNLERRLRRKSEREQAAEIGQEWLRRLVNPASIAPFWLLGRSDPERSPYVEFARRLGAWWAVLQSRPNGQPGLWPLVAVALAYAERLNPEGIPRGVRMWVEKTPTNEAFLARLWADFPMVKVIHVIRRPDAVLASHKAAMPLKWRPARTVATVYRNLARSYRIAVRQSQDASPERYHLVRYEDLLARPAEVVGGIADFLGIEPLDEMLSPTVAGRPATQNTSFTSGRECPDQGLTRIDLEWLAIVAGDDAAALGYGGFLPRTKWGKALARAGRVVREWPLKRQKSPLTARRS